ncbi:Uncharacterized SPBc2 prophage-derived protein YoqJ [Carnobacterium iners]|uniref:UPF0398 protein SAMN04488700_1822 n=1 Tax=Carnobacterium iners TaxID=1073423 RepID=A0A1X7NF95_9LACT|nr:DUF1273 domain-containing protein [Carnobacterium iners]SEK37030.1 Uncharacterized SPBc2 prophage-derived protein YoqJ [Carnobacterium iners]SMH35724.1 Uncharacterized SPBc2 prophage-derived protein YoqJ [Carnobacterium iners]
MAINLLVSGYRSFELGIFKDDDPKVAIIKKCLKEEIKAYIEEGVQWVLTTGQFGVEQWTIEVVEELKIDYPEVKQGIIFPFTEFGSNWNEKNQMALIQLKKTVDFTDSVSHQPYKDPSQLKNHQSFLLQKTQAALLVYDPENEGKTKWIYQAILKKQRAGEYDCRLIDFDQLQNTAIEE